MKSLISFVNLSRNAIAITSMVTVIAMSGCTNSSNDDSLPSVSNALADVSKQDGRSCIQTSRINGYAVNKDNVIAINTRGKYYLATTMYTCHDLDMASRALFDSRFSEACGGSSYIVTRGTRCPIRHIYEFENRKEAFAALDQARKLVEEAKSAPESEAEE